jgi:hypothetical protein
MPTDERIALIATVALVATEAVIVAAAILSPQFAQGAAGLATAVGAIMAAPATGFIALRASREIRNERTDGNGGGA